MDPELFRTLVAGVTSGLGTFGILALVFRGDKIVLARERKDAIDSKDAIIALKDKELNRLEAANEELQDELKASNANVAELAKQTLAAIAVLDRMGALAANERRRQPRNE